MTPLQLHKRKFTITLRPFLEMLEYKKSITTSRAWQKSVSKLEDRVRKEPEQYLGKELPSKARIGKIVTLIFNEFMHEHIPN